jgi:hypothetical protein
MEAAKTLAHLGHLIFLPSATGLDSFKTAPQSGHLNVVASMAGCLKKGKDYQGPGATKAVF